MRSKQKIPTTVTLATLALTTTGIGVIVIGQIHGQAGATSTSSNPTIEPYSTPQESASEAPKIDEPKLEKIIQVRDSSRVPMPLDPYMTSMDDIKIIDRAQDVGAALCMRSLNFKKWEEGTIRTRSPEDYRESDLFEYLDPKTVSQSGYPRHPETKSVSDRVSESKHEPTTEERKAYYGGAAQTKNGEPIPEGGCGVAADIKIRGGEADLPADPRDLAVGSRSRAIGDSRVQTVIVKWRSCMQEAGITRYDHPVPAENDPKWQSRKEETPPSAEEKYVASADASCREKVNLVGVYKTVRFAYEKQLLDENKEKIIESREIFKKWVENAKGIIGSD